MRSTRSSGPPTAASLQPFLMEAFENFKQKHSKQNQDLIHKNRLLLKSTAELERVIKELKNENIELRIQIQKANSLAQSWRQKAELTSDQFALNPQQADQIRLAVLDIVDRCKTLESSLVHPHPSSSCSNPEFTPILNSLPPAPSTANGLPSSLPVRNRSELLALRERRRSQLAVEPEESRLSFINECSGNEDRSEATLPFELAQTAPTNPGLPPKTSNSSNPTNQTSRFPPGPPNQLLIPSAHHNVAPRSKLRQELMAPFPKPLESREDPSASINNATDHQFEANDRRTSPLHGTDAAVEIPAEDYLHRDDSCDMANESLVDELNTGSFSAPNRAMSQYNQSNSPSTSDSDDDPDPTGNQVTSGELQIQNPHQEEQKTSILTQRRSKKQRRTSLTPQRILDTVSPASFSLDQSPLPPCDSLSIKNVDTSIKQLHQPDPSNLSQSNLSALDPIIALQPSVPKRRDSGLTKIEAEIKDGEAIEQLSSQDEGWEKRPMGKNKRPRAELDAVSEEYPCHEGTIMGYENSLPSNLSGAGPREARRARKEVNYALPSLNRKMRRPPSHGFLTGNRKSSASSNKNLSHSNANPGTTNKKPQSNSNCKSSGATPSTVQSNTSLSSVTNNTTLTTGSSPLSSTSSPLSSPSSPLSSHSSPSPNLSFSSSRLSSAIIPIDTPSAKSQEPVNMMGAHQQQQHDKISEVNKELIGDGKKSSLAEKRTAKNQSLSTSKKEKNVLSPGVTTAHIEETVVDVPHTRLRGTRRTSLENLAQRAEQKNKENGGASNRRKNLSSSTSSTTTTKKNLDDKNNIASGSTSNTFKNSAPNGSDDHKDDPLHLRGLRRMTREIAASIDLEKLTANFSDEGREFLFNPSYGRTQSLNSKQK